MAAHPFNNDKHACRVDDDGNLRRLPAIQNHGEIISDEDRIVIYKFCDEHNRQDATRFLLGKAKERERDFIRSMSGNLNAAARSTPISDKILLQWLMEFDSPTLF